MTNSTSGINTTATVDTGSKTRTSLSVPSTHACQVTGTLLFDTARSFISPDAAHKAAFQNLITRLQNPGSYNLLLISGHTDSVGSQASNQPLSQRRTQSAQAVLQANTGQWETLFNAESWGTPELSAMVIETGEADPSDPASVTKAVNRYRGSAKQAARADLFNRYFNRLLGGSAVPTIQTTTPPLLGCGQEQLLHGDRGSPSRDTSLPPIEGDFRPNRRVEFYFFDSTATSISCSEYPKWTAACSLTPPATTTTVTIAKFDTVKKGGSTDVQITLNPSPLAAGQSITLTLSATSGTGEARFARSNSTTTTITSSGTVTISGITESSAFNNMRLSASLTGQPAILAQQDFTVTNTFSFFLKFEVWNLTSRAFEPLPAGVSVDIIDNDPGLNDLLGTSQTDAQGRVIFNLSDFKASGEEHPDLFFLAHTNEINHAGHKLPKSWSTKGWKATDGTSGYQPKFSGTSLGTPSAPLVFRIGLDFHARFEYLHVPKGTFAPAPKAVPVDIQSGALGRDPRTTITTDENGEVHGVVFNVDAGDDFFYHVNFEMTDASINLPRAMIQMSQAGWSTIWDDADRKYFPNNDLTSIGTQSSPEIFHCTVNDRNAAMYFLKILREWSIFLFHITGGAWTGVNNLTMYRTSLPGRGYSWPLGEVNIPPKDHWDRSTLIHELSHQIMWKEANYSTLGIATIFVTGIYHHNHDFFLITDPITALIEGWAEFMEAVFTGKRTPPFTVSTLLDSKGKPVPLGPPPIGQGESVEGAFADGLWAIFQNHVVTSAVTVDAHILESKNGDVTGGAPWLSNTAVRDRFLSMIWHPLQDLKPLLLANSRDMFSKIRSRNLTVWHVLQPELQNFNTAMTVPTVTSIAPTSGPVSGGTSVTITGTEFTQGTTSVTIGGVAATAVTVNSTTSLTATTPVGTAGAADVVVTTPASSSAPLAGGFTYTL